MSIVDYAFRTPAIAGDNNPFPFPLPDRTPQDLIDKIRKALQPKEVVYLPTIAQVSTLLPQCTNLLRTLKAVLSESTMLETEHFGNNERLIEIRTEIAWLDSERRSDLLGRYDIAAKARETEAETACTELASQVDALDTIIQMFDDAYMARAKEISYENAAAANFGSSPALMSKLTTGSLAAVTQMPEAAAVGAELALPSDTYLRALAAAEAWKTQQSAKVFKSQLNEAKIALKVRQADMAGTKKALELNDLNVQLERAQAEQRRVALREQEQRLVDYIAVKERDYGNRYAGLIDEFIATAGELKAQSELLGAALFRTYAIGTSTYAPFSPDAEGIISSAAVEIAKFELSLTKTNLALDAIAMQVAHSWKAYTVTLRRTEGKNYLGSLAVEGDGWLSSIAIMMAEAGPDASVGFISQGERRTIDGLGRVIDMSSFSVVDTIPLAVTTSLTEAAQFAANGAAIHERVLPLQLNVMAQTPEDRDLDELTCTLMLNIGWRLKRETRG
jgi:hypothetical protein